MLVGSGYTVGMSKVRRPATLKVVVDGKEVYSKRVFKRIPNQEELVGIIEGG